MDLCDWWWWWSRSCLPSGDVKAQAKEDSLEEKAQQTALAARDDEIARLKAQLVRSSFVTLFFSNPDIS